MRELRSILLTGGAGFIGSSLARHLLRVEQLERLIVLDKLTYAGNRSNLGALEDDPRFHFVKGDIADRALVAALLKQEAVTGVFNLAAESHVDHSIDDAEDFIATNIVGTANLLEECRGAKVSLLQCSTDEVYGSATPPAKFTEESPLIPSSAYSASKASGDLLCLAASITHQQDVLVTRSSNNYGPRQHAEKLIPTIVRHAIQDEPIPIYGDGMHIRDWIHVDDHCRGMLAAFLRGRAGQIYNFGGHCERTNLGLTRNILQILGKPDSLISRAPDRPGHDRRYAIDTTKALRYFGWNPREELMPSLPAIVRELAANFSQAPGSSQSRFEASESLTADQATRPKIPPRRTPPPSSKPEISPGSWLPPKR